MKFELLVLVSKTYDLKGKQKVTTNTQHQTLAKLRSIEASNRLEGIFTNHKQLYDLMLKKGEPKKRVDQDIARYRDVLEFVGDHYSSINISQHDILSLHNRLYSYYPNQYKRMFKHFNNIISEVNYDTKFIRDVFVDALVSDEHMNALIHAFNQAFMNPLVDPLLVIPCFILVFYVFIPLMMRMVVWHNYLHCYV